MRAPARPLTAVALALAAGSAATAHGERDGALAVAALAGAGTAAAASSLGPGSTRWLLALAAAAALRAASAGPLQVSSAHAGAAEDGHLPVLALGTLSPQRGSTPFGDDRYRLAPEGLALELAPGVARAGEWAAVLAGSTALLPATGPCTEARARRPVALLPRPDEIVRLGGAAEGGAASSRLALVARAADALEAARGEGLARLAAAGRGARDTAGGTAFEPAWQRTGWLGFPDAPESELDAVDDGASAPRADRSRRAPSPTESDARPAAPLRWARAELPHAGLLGALLLGASDEVDYEVAEHFTRTGTRHLLALSGLHVGLVAWLLGRPLVQGAHALAGAAARSRLAALLARATSAALPTASMVGGWLAPWLLRRWPGAAARRARTRGLVPRGLVPRGAGSSGVGSPSAGRRELVAAHARTAMRLLASPSALLAVAALAFVPLAGSGAPAARAALALALGSLADLVGRGPARGRRPDAVTLWSAALLLEVLAEPSAVLAAGVQLSYGATLALVLTFRPTHALLAAALPGGGRIALVDRNGRRRSALWRAPAQRLLGALLGALAAGLVATVATLPVTWARFGEWSPVGIVATPLALPFVTAGLAGGYAWLLAPDLAPLALPAWALELLVRTLAACDALPATPLVLPPASADLLAPLAAAALALAVVAARARRRGARALALGFAAAAVLAPMRRSPAPPRGLEVVACDVGHGRALLVRSEGLGVWLVDGASRDRVGVARRAVLPVLRAWGAREIGVAQTADPGPGSGALAWLAERFEVHTWLGGAAPDGPSGRGDAIHHVDVEKGALALRLGGPAGRGERAQWGEPPEDAPAARDPADPGRAEVVLLRGATGLRTLAFRSGTEELWVLGGGADADQAADDLLGRGLLAPARAVRLVSWPPGGLGRSTGAVLDALAPTQVWSPSPGSDGLGRELARRGVARAHPPAGPTLAPHVDS